MKAVLIVATKAVLIVQRRVTTILRAIRFGRGWVTNGVGVAGRLRRLV